LTRKRGSLRLAQGGPNEDGLLDADEKKRKLLCGD